MNLSKYWSKGDQNKPFLLEKDNNKQKTQKIPKGKI